MEYGVIAGRVVDATSEKPIAGAHVTIIRIVETPQGVFGEESRHLLTDASGEFVFARRIPGRHRIDVEKSGFAPSFDPFDVTLFDLDAGQSINDVQIPLKRGGVVSGGVRDDTGEPQPDMTVWAMRLIPQHRQSGLDMIQGGVGQTNDLGEFRIANLQEGEYVVIAAEHRGRFGADLSPRAKVPSRTYYPGTTERASAQTVSIRAGQTVAGLWFSMIFGAAFNVSGEVLDATGTRLRGAMVTLMPSFRLDIPGSPIMTQSDSDGTFQIGGVAPGTYYLSATALTDPSAGGFFLDVASETVTVKHGDGDDSAMIIQQPSSRPRQRVIVENSDVTGLTVVAPSR